MSRGKSSHQFGKGAGIGQNAPNQADIRPDRRMFRPHIEHDTGKYVGKVYCSRCHAIYENKRWHLDEKVYEGLVADTSIDAVICPGCERVERQEYDGHVKLTSPLIPANQESIMGLIKNTEAYIRSHNPLARIASLTFDGETVEVLTISTFLAERIGKELRKAYDGTLEIKMNDAENFVRVTWWRE